MPLLPMPAGAHALYDRLVALGSKRGFDSCNFPCTINFVVGLWQTFVNAVIYHFWFLVHGMFSYLYVLYFVF